jgi:hypothetical protein
VPPPDAATPRRAVVIADRTELGPLGAEFRGLIERELGHGLAFGKAAEARTELEQLLERHGIERALSWVGQTVMARRKTGGSEPGSVEYVLAILRDMPEREVGAVERIRGECPEWAAMLDAALQLRGEDRPAEELVDRWLLPLQAAFLRGELHLEAPSPWHEAFVRDRFLPGLARLALEAIGPHVLVKLTAAAETVAREA